MTHVFRIFLLSVTLLPDDEVAHECKRGGGVVVGHEVACVEDVVVAEAALRKRKKGKEVSFGNLAWLGCAGECRR